MKIIIAISLMLLSSLVLACPDLSGTYYINEFPITIKQIDCSIFTQMSSSERDSFSIKIDGKKYLIENFNFYDYKTGKLLNVDRYAMSTFENDNFIINSKYLVTPIRGGRLKIETRKTVYRLNSNNDLVITDTGNDGSVATYTYERY